MARFLKFNIQKAFIIIWLIILICGLFAIKTVLAGSVYSKFTGYAMGNRLGAFNVEVTYGHFANHGTTSQGCYEGWPYNTRIQTPQSVAMHTPGGTVYFSTFYLKDRGDIYCAMPPYWVDLYFGRMRISPNPCNCPGSPSPGYCINGSYNNCNDAINFGTRWWTYMYTFP